jgi:hypothetical protein
LQPFVDVGSDVHTAVELVAVHCVARRCAALCVRGVGIVRPERCASLSMLCPVIATGCAGALPGPAAKESQRQKMRPN